MTTQIIYQKNFISDLDGTPLQGGKLFIGEANQDPELFPITVYWDPELLDVADQPLSISAGSVVNNGIRAAVYTDEDSYSFRARNRANEQVDYVADAIDGSLRGELSGTGGAAMIGTASGGTVQDAVDVVEALPGDDGTAEIGYKYDATASVLMTLRAYLDTLPLNIFGFGAVGDGVANDLPAFEACLAACKIFGKSMFIPGGYTYKFDGGGNPIVIDPAVMRDGALRAIAIRGDTAYQSVINVVNTGSSRGIYMTSSSDWFDSFIENITITGSIGGPLFTLGNDDLSTDPVNTIRWQNVRILNSANSADNEALRLNFVAIGGFDNVICNSYATAGDARNGTALRLRKVISMSFINGAFGNAYYGVRFTDDANLNCTFISNTFENCYYCVRHDTSDGGGHYMAGAQFTEVVGYALSSTGMLTDRSLLVESYNYGDDPLHPGAELIDPVNFVGIVVRDRVGLTPPTLTGSSPWSFTNNTGRVISVYVNGGAISSYAINGGTTRTFATNNTIPVPIMPGWTVALAGASVPTLSFLNISAG